MDYINGRYFRSAVYESYWLIVVVLTLLLVVTLAFFSKWLAIMWAIVLPITGYVYLEEVLKFFTFEVKRDEMAVIISENSGIVVVVPKYIPGNIFSQWKNIFSKENPQTFLGEGRYFLMPRLPFVTPEKVRHFRANQIAVVTEPVANAIVRGTVDDGGGTKKIVLQSAGNCGIIMDNFIISNATTNNMIDIQVCKITLQMQVSINFLPSSVHNQVANPYHLRSVDQVVRSLLYSRDANGIKWDDWGSRADQIMFEQKRNFYAYFHFLVRKALNQVITSDSTVDSLEKAQMELTRLNENFNRTFNVEFSRLFPDLSTSIKFNLLMSIEPPGKVVEAEVDQQIRKRNQLTENEMAQLKIAEEKAKKEQAILRAEGMQKEKLAEVAGQRALEEIRRDQIEKAAQKGLPVLPSGVQIVSMGGSGNDLAAKAADAQILGSALGNAVGNAVAQAMRQSQQQRGGNQRGNGGNRGGNRPTQSPQNNPPQNPPA